MKRKNRKELDKWIKTGKIILKDFHHKHGGWTHFAIRMVSNAFFLWLWFSFISAFWFFAFADFDVLDVEKAKSLKNILWIFGIIYIAIKVLFDTDNYGDCKS